MTSLRLHEVHTFFLDQRFSSVSVLQEGFSREVCFDSVFPQVTGTQDRFRHFHHVKVVLSRVFSDLQPDLTLSIVLECSSVGTSELN